jgi:hypothetical protein
VAGSTVQRLSHSANPAIKFGAGRVNRTLVGEVQALCTATVLDQLIKTSKLWSWRAASNRGRSLTVRLLFPLSYTSGAGAAIRSTPARENRAAGDPVERRSRTYEARALPTELHQQFSENPGGGGENCTPDCLLCRQMPCCLGYTALQTWSGRRDLNPRSRRWQRRVLAARRLPHGASSES